MYRNNYKKYVPTCPKTIPVVDQYLWKDRDTNQYTCDNGVSHSIYDCQGNVSFTLPLEMYPPGGEIHPQIPLSNRMHYNYRMSPDFLVEMGSVGGSGGRSSSQPAGISPAPGSSIEAYGPEGGSRSGAGVWPIQRQLLDAGMFDTNTPSFFGHVEGYGPSGGSRSGAGVWPIQRQLLDAGMFDTNTPSFFRGDARQSTEGYGSDPSYVRDYDSMRRYNRPEERSGLQLIQPYNLEHFIEPQQSMRMAPTRGAPARIDERFSQIPTDANQFPLVYQSPIMVKGHTMGNPYGIRAGSECKGLYGV